MKNNKVRGLSSLLISQPKIDSQLRYFQNVWIVFSLYVLRLVGLYSELNTNR
jgi:hypothetical protein